MDAAGVVGENEDNNSALVRAISKDTIRSKGKSRAIDVDNSEDRGHIRLGKSKNSGLRFFYRHSHQN